MIRFAHIINPVSVDPSSDLFTAQPVTFETMRRASALCKGTIEVELFTAQFPEDRSLVPDGFVSTRDLERSVLDVKNFACSRKLPLLRDILDLLYESSRADYFIYSNVDIGLMPHFYESVAQLIESGMDAMVVNRRTITKSLSDPSLLPLMWAQVGEKHPGHDCFVFKREAYSNFHLGDVCIGINWVGRVLLWNLLAHAENFRELKDVHLTFHLGDDKSWKNPALMDYVEHNRSEALKIYAQLCDELGEKVVLRKLEGYVDRADLDNSRHGLKTLLAKIFRI